MPIFPSATLQKNNEIPNQSNFLGLRKDKKRLGKFLKLLLNYNYPPSETVDDEMVTDQDMVTDDNDEKTTPDQTSNPPSDAKRIRLDEDTKQRFLDNLYLFAGLFIRTIFFRFIFIA